jgi:6-phosphogluconolactonase
LETFFRTVADWLTDYCAEVLTRQDRFTIALSGGSTPKALHQLLAGPDYRDRIDWAKWHVFFGDERFVPLNDERNNAAMAFETLLNHVPVPPNQIHIMQTENTTPAQSMADYGALLHRYFDGSETTFDVVLLGLGDDGHTLSLFPGMDVVHEKTNWTSAFWLEAQEMYRLTLTAPVVNRAAAVAFLVSGEKKKHALHEVQHGIYDPDLYPAQVIKPVSGQLLWFVAP